VCMAVWFSLFYLWPVHISSTQLVTRSQYELEAHLFSLYRFRHSPRRLLAVMQSAVTCSIHPTSSCLVQLPPPPHTHTLQSLLLLRVEILNSRLITISARIIIFENYVMHALHMTHISDGCDHLHTDDGFEIMVWVGKSASRDERKQGLSMAAKYLHQSGLPKDTPISSCVEGSEGEVCWHPFSPSLSICLCILYKSLLLSICSRVCEFRGMRSLLICLMLEA
jgi:hypothetical protein